MVSASALSALAGAVSSMAPSLSGVPAITSQAAEAAAFDLKRARSSSGRAYATSRGNEERLRRRSRKMAKEFQDKLEKNVKRKLDRMSGPDDNRKVGLKVAQFVPGKGLEIPGAQSESDRSIYCSLGVKSDKIVDPLEETFSRIKGRQVSMDFAFKLIKDKDDIVTHDKKTRVTVFNAFRHVNPDSFNFSKTGWTNAADNTAKKTANYNWHTTLGPDAAPVRRAVGGYVSAGARCGVWRGIKNEKGIADIGGLATVADSQGNPDPSLGAALQANSLMSPYRYPKDLEFMFSRINRQLMENYGWKLNPFKFVNFSQMTSAVSQQSPTRGSLEVWQDPNELFMNFNSTSAVADSGEQLKWSFPANVNNEVGPATATSPVGGKFEYHSQFGPGKLSYQFQNDGTNPVCIDICVIGIKKDSSVPVDLLKNIFEYNYKVAQRQSAGVTRLNGFQTEDLDSATDLTQPDTLDWTQGVSDWHADAKLPFIPDSCFKNPASYLKSVDPTVLPSSGEQQIYKLLEQGKNNPFKLVKRDQFIVSSGSSRAWNTTLPSIKYRPQLYEDVDYPQDASIYVTPTTAQYVSPTADEYTFVLAIGASGLPKPVEEVFPIVADISDGQSTADYKDTDAKSIVDRQPSTCNVSVVGTYTETIHPCFPKDVSDVNFINGRLTAPYFASQPTNYTPSINDIAPDRVNTVDIAQLGQVVHTTSNGIVGVGAITTDIGA